MEPSGSNCELLAATVEGPLRLLHTLTLTLRLPGWAGFEGTPENPEYLCNIDL